MSRKIVLGGGAIAIAVDGQDALTATGENLAFDSNLASCPVLSRSYVDLDSGSYTDSKYVYFSKTFSGIPLVSIAFSPSGAPWNQAVADRKLIYLFRGTAKNLSITIGKVDDDSYKEIAITTSASAVRVYQNSINGGDSASWLTGYMIVVVYDYREELS